METKPLNFFEKASNWLRQSVTIRLITIGILLLLLLIPVSMIESLIRERETRRQEAINEVSSKWGEPQTVIGPILTVPYKSFSKVYDNDNSGKYRLVESRAYAHFLPEDLNIHGSATPELRKRGIFKVIVYNSDLTLSGKFDFPNFEEWKIDDQYIIWDDAYVSIGLNDLRSIQENISIDWNGKNYFFNPGMESNDVISSGISVKLKQLATDTSHTEITFSMKMDFNGSSDLNFVPVGKTTTVNIESPWSSPKFDGAFLPDHREVTASGFNATWKVLHLNRPYPQSFRGAVPGIYDSMFGVSLIVPVDEYQKSMRSAKYAVMFIALTFLVFFFVQVLNRVRIHPVQYIMVGLALCVFYTLLLALSEHITFGLAYLSASTAIIGLITLYAKAIFNNRKLTGLVFLILVILYLFIFSIIQMEDYALLMGSVGLFVVLSIVMYLSRKIDWYGLNRNDG
jgi:inner membrane protein